MDEISHASYTSSLRETFAKCYAPWSRMPPEEWAENVYRLPNGVRFDWDYAPFALGMFRSIFDRAARETVFQCFSRGFKTTCTLLAAGYFIDQSPRRILWMWQTMGHAEKFSKEGLGGELFDTTAPLNFLSSSTGNRRISSNTITFKRFPGGSLNLFGANAPGELRRAKGNLLINYYTINGQKERFRRGDAKEWHHYVATRYRSPMAGSDGKVKKYKHLSPSAWPHLRSCPGHSSRKKSSLACFGSCKRNSWPATCAAILTPIRRSS